MKKVLLISYYFDPFNGVGAKRMSYWANAFLGDEVPVFECTVMTATPQPEGRDNVLYVEDEKRLWVDRFIQGIRGYDNSTQGIFGVKVSKLDKATAQKIEVRWSEY